MPGKDATDAQRKRNREAADWILRNGDARRTEAQKRRFEAWLAADPENCRTYEAAERLMGDARRAIESDPDLSTAPLNARTRTGPVLLSLLLLAGAGAGFVALDGPMRLQADLISGTGEMPVVTLEDGSVVQLNASSALALDFSETRRGVRLLRGQAFFQVAHDAGRPFSVEAGPTRVTALGTAFDVRYGQAETDVAVTENAVIIERADGQGAPQRVTQGEQARIAEETGKAEVTPVDPLVALAWRRGQIALDNVPLSFVVEEMNRHRAGRIVIAGSALAERRVSGTIAVADTDAALAFLKQALGIRFTRLGPLIVIRS
ncbi:iron dicitrate transport regulator FecR [Rhizobium rhizosphaerae]|uniref:Iron dicitrate transport regulator FecR n=1 Tax=Xaviernesmea rhizosphaerae TaxID=1672749 RepID=A0A1Q9AE03_9HYPH|nr:FecR family protein [Xaviernesmea rhizosphaerae]OLP53160.1 iron dicitrate transport regulator FecR [Xaviernesmea rhizosphaerae]